MANIESGEGGTPREAARPTHSHSRQWVRAGPMTPFSATRTGRPRPRSAASGCARRPRCSSAWSFSRVVSGEGRSCRRTKGALAQAASRRCGPSSPAARPSRTGSSLFGSGGATTGTVTDVIGKTLYITSSSGSLVKVTLGPSATVTRNATSSLADLKIGDTVIVEGVKTKSGAVTASSISATAAGVSSSFASTALGGG